MDLGYQNVDGQVERKFSKFKFGSIGTAVLTGCVLLWWQGPHNIPPTQAASLDSDLFEEPDDVDTMPEDEEEVSVELSLDDSQLGAVDNVWGITEEEYVLVFGKDGPHPDHIANLRQHRSAVPNSTEFEPLDMPEVPLDADMFEEPEELEGCVDKARYCPAWKNSGYCTNYKYKAYMSQNCEASCGLCGAPAPTCVDKVRYCPAWKKSGYCTNKFKAYMSHNCKASCGLCGAPTPGPTPPTGGSTGALHGGVDVDKDPDAHAIYQGMLGDCYFDAALAAIAHTHSSRIKANFVWMDVKRGVFSTKWFVGGRWVRVTVNAKVPTNPQSGVPYFLWTSSQLTLWPAIMEKSYAKLVGTYKAIEGGSPGEAMQYVLGSPVTTVCCSSAKLKNMFPTIKAAVDAGLPMGIGTSTGGYHGIHGGHAYTLYGASENYKGYGKAVRVRNPWGINSYTGDIKGQDKLIGDVWITWNEFLRNYVMLNIANLKVGYKNVNVGSIPVLGNSVRGRVSVQVNSDKDFEIMVIAPTARIAKAAGCTLQGESALIYATSPNGNTVRGGFEGGGTGLMVKGKGRGKWSVYVSYSGVFQNLPKFVVSVYVDGTASAGRAMMLTELPADLVMENSSDVMMSEPPLPEPTELYACTDYFRRLIFLNNNPVPTDRMFPETTSSIAQPGVNCGDAAHGYRKSCSVFNHWKSAEVVANAMNDGLKCLSFTPVGGKCHVSNTKCNKPAMFFCKTMKCSSGFSVAPNKYSYYILPPGCCTCNDPATFR